MSILGRTAPARLLGTGLLLAALLPGGPARALPPLECQDFVNYAMQAQAQYYARGCAQIPLMHANREGHFQWCLRKNEAEVRADRNAKAAALQSCLAAGSAPAGAAPPPARPFGAGFDGWSFTATTETPGVVNCRAIRKVGGREDILAKLTDNRPSYISVKAEGRRGKWPRSVVTVPGKPRGQFEWLPTAEANGTRLWFPLEDGAIAEIAAAGGYDWSLRDSEDSGRVNLGRRAGEAWERVNQCFYANRR